MSDTFALFLHDITYEDVIPKLNKPEQAFERTIELRVIRDPMTLIWRHWNISSKGFTTVPF